MNTFPILEKLEQETSDQNLKKEIQQILALVSNGAKKVVEAVKKVTKFVKEIALPKQEKAINLNEFFTQGKKDQPLYIWDNFKSALDDATSDKKKAPTDPDQFFLHETTQKAMGNDIMKSVKEDVVDLSTAEGRVEARKRFGALAHLLSNQSTGQDGYLQTNGYSTTIGWMKLKSGVVLAVSVYWGSGGRKWRCGGDDLGKWRAEHQFFSRNGEA